MINEYEFGQPRPFLNKDVTVERVRALNIARCGKCGRRVERSKDGEWCDLCMKDTVVADKE